MTIEKGDRVFLTQKHFTPCSSYPVIGSPVECAGTVSVTSATRAGINWDNGNKNDFRKEDLSLVSDCTDNSRCKSIW